MEFEVEVIQHLDQDGPVATIPTVDFASWEKPENQTRVIEQVALASQFHGIFKVVGSDVSQEVAAACVSAARAFFSLDLQTKRKSAAGGTLVGFAVRGPDAYHDGELNGHHLKEIFNIGPPDSPVWQNTYPDAPSGFRNCVISYYRELERLEGQLLHAFSMALASLIGTPLPSNYLAKEKGRHRGLLRLNYYPKIDFKPSPDTLRDGAHSDWSPFTILFTEHEGLELLQDGAWKHVPVSPQGFIVLVGDQLHWWSNGRFPVAVHRVNAHNCQVKSRLSLAFFSTEAIDPTDTRLTRPLCALGEQPKFKAFSIRDYLLENFASAHLSNCRLLSTFDTDSGSLLEK